MQELEAWIALSKLFEDAPHAEVVATLVRIVKQDDGLIGQFRQPALEIMRDRIEGVVAVDVQDVDRLVREGAQRLVERAAQQRRERGKPVIVEAAERFVDFLAVLTRLRIASPCVHRMATGAEPAQQDGLAECGIRDAVMRAQLHQDARPGLVHQPMGKWHVRPPRAHGPDALSPPEERRQRRTEKIIEAAAARRIVRSHRRTRTLHHLVLCNRR